MTRKRVLWLSQAVPWPPKTGMLQRSYNLLRQLTRRHEVHLYALNQRALLSEPERLRAAVIELERICERVVVHEIASDRSPVHRALLLAESLFSSQPYDVNWLRSRRLAAALERVSRAERFDLIHVDTLGMFPYTKTFAGTQIALNHHNVESQLLLRRSAREHNPAKRLYFRNEARKFLKFEQRVCPQVGVNLAVSPLDAERLVAIVGDAAVRVVDNGVDVEYFRPTSEPEADRRSLVFAGGMGWYANREAALFLVRDLWPKLIERDPKWELWIVGADPPPTVRAAARDGRVEVPGFVDDVRPYLDRAEIYVCPIFDGGGTRLKILDALAMAKPLVATGLAVEGLGLEEERHYLRAETPAKFVAQIRRLDQEPALRRELARSGRSFVESRFSWSVIGGKLEDAYASVLNDAQAEPS